MDNEEMEKLMETFEELSRVREETLNKIKEYGLLNNSFSDNEEIEVKSQSRD